MNKIQIKKKAIILFIEIGVALVIAGLLGVRAYENSPTRRANAALELGNQYLSELNYKEAITAFREAIAIDPSNEAWKRIEDAYYQWGSSYVEASAFEDGIKVFEDARQEVTSEQIGKAERSAYLEWAKQYYTSAEFEQAVAILDQCPEDLQDDQYYTILQEYVSRLEYQREGEEDVVWTDPVLEVLIKDAIGVESDADVKIKDLDYIQTMFLWGDKKCSINRGMQNEPAEHITVRGAHWENDVATLEYFWKEGEYKDTERGMVSNINSLIYFRNLVSLEIIANSISDVSALRQMQLDYCCLWNNLITDLSPIDSVPNTEQTMCFNQEQGVEIGDIITGDISQIKNNVSHLDLDKR